MAGLRQPRTDDKENAVHARPDTPTERVLARVLAWAAADANVRRLVLVGSRAAHGVPNELADIDIQVYASTHEPYTTDDCWLSEIARLWVCVKDAYDDNGIRVPTRLAIFDHAVKVDFAFYPAAAESDTIRIGLAYRVLLDKDQSARRNGAVSQPSCAVAAPVEAEFARVIEEFWLEVYHVAKYLARDELWLAKSRDWATKQFLGQLIQWNEHTRRQHISEPHCAGKRASTCDDTWQALHRTFASFGREDSWDALVATTALFRRLAMETATARGFAYPVDLDKNITGVLHHLKQAQEKPL